MALAFVVMEGLLLMFCGALNCLYFQRYRKRPQLARRRRVGAIVLALLNGGIALESSHALALYALQQRDEPASVLLAPIPWLAARSVLLAATMAITGLIVWQEWSTGKRR
jgi:hypothetical protein